MTTAVLQLQDVHKSFTTPAGPLHVLNGVDLRVEPGEIVVVTGRSGSGKTTLLTIAAGWAQPDQGTVRFANGHDVPPWREIAIAPQSLGLLEELTVAENVALPKRLDGDRSAAAVDELMEELGLAHLAKRYPSEISLGERQRAAIARAAILRPQLLVADEPIAHQNTEFAYTLISLLRQLADEGSACLVASHDELAVNAADRVISLASGTVA